MQNLINRIFSAKIIFFDWDNTIANSFDAIHHSLHQTFIKMGRVPLTRGDLLSNKYGIHRSLRCSFPEIFGDNWEEARQHYYSEFSKCHLEQITLIKNAESFIQKLYNNGVLLFVISNKSSGYLHREVEHFALDKYFKCIVGSGDATKDKPDTAMIEYALQKYYNSKSNNGSESEGKMLITAEEKQAVFFIGDSIIDMETALKFGCHPIKFGNGICDKALNNLKQKYCHQQEIAHIEKYCDYI